jgi:hypothetical protein
MGRQHQKQRSMPNCKPNVCKSFSLRTAGDLSKIYSTIIYVFSLLLRGSSSLVGGRRNLRYCFSQKSRNEIESIHTLGKCDLYVTEVSGLLRRPLSGHQEYFTWNKFTPAALYCIILKGIALIESLNL